MSIKRMKMFTIVRSSFNLYLKPNSTYSSLLTLEQEISFNIALEEDEDLNMLLLDEMTVEDLEFIYKYDDDFHQNFDTYFLIC